MERKTYLDRYRVIVDAKGVPVELGSSVAGVIYKAEDIESGELVAVNLIRSEMLSPATLEEIEAEAPKAHELNHPNIARVQDIGVDGEHVVYVREFLEGSTLQEWVTSHGPLPVGAVLRIGSQVVSALAAAAFHSIRHRSLQPANLMIVPGQTPEGEWPLVKVLNFGAPPPTFQRSGFTTVGVGNSAQFASPEQLVGGTVDFRSEIYSLGSTLWFLLTGAPPATDEAVSRFSGVPKNVRKLIAKMIATDAHERPKDPLILQEHFRDCLARVDRREAIGRRFGMPLVSAPRAAAAPAAAPPPPPIAAAPLPPALAPEATANTIPAFSGARAPRRAIPWKSLALAAMLIALGAIGALVLTNASNSDRLANDESEPIGVPIGVPEASTVTTAANTTTAPAQAAEQPAAVVAADNSATASAPAETQSAAPAESSAETTVAENTSTAAPASENQIADPSAPASDSQAGDASVPTIVSNDDASAPAEASAVSSPAPSNAPTVVASNTTQSATQSDDPAPPAEGPDDVAAAPPAPAPSQDSTFAASGSSQSTQPDAQPARTAKSSSANQATTERSTASSDVARATTAKTETTESAPAKKPRREREEVRVAERVNNSPRAEEALPALPAGSRRARYLGTREDGAMIFSLPSSERVYAAPPAERKIPSPRRRIRRLLTPDPAPVVVDPQPAEPVEEYVPEDE